MDRDHVKPPSAAVTGAEPGVHAGARGPQPAGCVVGSLPYAPAVQLETSRGGARGGGFGHISDKLNVVIMFEPTADR